MPYPSRYGRPGERGSRAGAVGITGMPCTFYLSSLNHNNALTESESPFKILTMARFYPEDKSLRISICGLQQVNKAWVVSPISHHTARFRNGVLKLLCCYCMIVAVLNS
jgi:hypothetical protein